MRQARDKAGADRIAATGRYDRDAFGRLLRGTDSLRTRGNDHIDVKRDEFGGELTQRLRRNIRTILDDQVPGFVEAGVMQAFQERGPEPLVGKQANPSRSAY